MFDPVLVFRGGQFCDLGANEGMTLQRKRQIRGNCVQHACIMYDCIQHAYQRPSPEFTSYTF